MEDKVFLDTKLMHSGFLHALIQDGGQIKFQNYPFGIRFVGTGGPQVEIQLFAVPVGINVSTHKNPTLPKKVKEKPEKPIKPEIKIEEEEAYEL